MPSNYTPNYDLSQWEAGDPVQCADFNADNTKIDAAIKAVDAKADSKVSQSALNALSQTVAGKARVAAGSYTGDSSTSRTISVGFTPKAVLVMTSQGEIGTFSSRYYSYGGLAVTGAPACLSLINESQNCVEIVSGGFRVYQKTDFTYIDVNTNKTGTTYHYLTVG